MDLRKTLLATLATAVASSTVFAAPLTPPLTFVGINPCRIFDTRGGSFTLQAGSPALSAGASRTFQITGTVPGVPTQCGIPDTALAISVNFTVTGFAGQGDIRVYPAGGTLPAASILNYQLENIANATTVPLGYSGGGHFGIAIQADAASTQILADVNGYYIPSTTASSGTTMTGAFSSLVSATAANQYTFIQVSFPQRLASAPAAPNTNFIPPPGTASTTNCPGTVSSPQAAPGQFCAYAGFCANATFWCFASPINDSCTVYSASGGIISVYSGAAGQSYCAGTWAVTAP